MRHGQKPKPFSARQKRARPRGETVAKKVARKIVNHYTQDMERIAIVEQLFIGPITEALRVNAEIHIKPIIDDAAKRIAYAAKSTAIQIDDEAAALLADLVIFAGQQLKTHLGAPGAPGASKPAARSSHKK